MRFADKRGGEADSNAIRLAGFKSMKSLKQAGIRNVWPLVLLLAVISIASYSIFIFAADVDVESPPNASISTNGSVSLFCEVKIDSDANFGPNNLTNVSLWINSTGAWIRNATVSDMSNASNIFNATGGGVKVQFNLSTLGTKRGDFYWFCSVAANASHAIVNESRNESYKTFKVDRTAPVIRLRNPLNGGYLNSTTKASWEVELLEHNPNATNVSFYYRRGAQGTFQAFKPMICARSPAGQYEDSNNCTIEVDIATEAEGSDTDVIYFYFNASDIGNQTTSNGTLSSPWSVTVDTRYPVLNAFNITGAGVNWNTRTSTATLFNVTFNLSDTSPQNCTLLHNISSAGYLSNYTRSYATNGTQNFTIPNVNGIAFSGNGSGIYNFTITCNDSAANTLTTARNLTIAVDTQAPNVTINSPANNISLRTRTLFVNFTPEDNMNNTRPSAVVNDSLVSAGNDSCELWTNMTGAWALNTTVTNKSGFANYAGIHNFTLTFSSDGKYFFAVQCNDTAGNKNSSTNLTINIDTTQPTINAFNETLVNWNTRNVNSSSFLFTINISDQSNDTCFIYHNVSSAGMVQNVTAKVADARNTTFPRIELGDNGSGVVNVTFQCNDTAGNIVYSSANYTFVVDTQAPNVTLMDNATRNGWMATRTIQFTFAAADNMNSTLRPVEMGNSNVSGGNDSCELWTNMTGTWQVNKTLRYANNNSQANISTTSFTDDGIYIWNVQCNDSANNLGVDSANNTLKVDATTPVLTLTVPGNGSRFISGTATQFHINATELNLNTTYNGNTTVWYRKLGGSGIWRNANLTCTGTAPALNCSATVDTSNIVLTGETMEYYFELTDKAANTGNNGTSTNPLTAVSDSIAPSMNSTNASGINWNTRTAATKSITFSVTATEANPANCTVFTNMTAAWAGNESSTAVYTNGGNSSLTAFSLSQEGVFNYTIRCNDTAGNVNFTTTNYSFGVDVTAPNVTLSLPAASGTSRTTNISVSFTPADAFNNSGVLGNRLGNDSCELWTNITGTWALNSTTTNSSSAFLNSYGLHNISILLTQGDYLWNVQCNDTAGNKGVGSSNRTLTVDTTVPVLNTLNASAVEWNKRTANVRSITFHFNTTDANTGGCAIWENSTGTFTQNLTTTYTSNANTSIGPINFSGDTVVNVTLNCSDGPGNHQWFASNLTFVVDLAAPNVTLNAPGNASKINGSSVGFQFTPVDNMNNSGVFGNSGGNESCALWTNMTGSWVMNTTSTNYSAFLNSYGPHNFTLTLADGDYLWNVQCNDTARNIGVGSTNRTLVVDNNNPVIQSFNASPVDWNTKTSAQRAVTLYFNVTDNHSNSCTLFHNATGSHASNVTLNYTSNANTTTTVTFSADGSYNFSLQCTDNSGRSSTTSTAQNFTIAIDSSAPAVALVAPPSGSRRGATVLFNFTPSDNLTLHTCQIFTNSSGNNAFVSNYSNLTPTPNVNNNATLTFGVEGSYAWNVRCNDTAGNAAFNSSNYTLTIDANGPILANWTYNESSKMLILGFNEQIDTNITGVTLGSISLNYTDGSIADGVANLGNANSSIIPANSTTIFVLLTSGQDAAVRKIQRNDPTGKVNITLYGGAVKDLAGNNVVANTSRFKNYYKVWHESPSWPGTLTTELTIPRTSTLESWGWASGTTQTWNISLILSDIGKLGANYNVVYYNTDGTDNGWKAFVRTDWAGSNLQYINNTNDKDYQINMTGNSTRFELCCRTLT